MKENKTNTKKESTKSKDCGCGKKGCKGDKSSKQEDESDPFGCYTGNPVGFGKYAEPVQDVDDL